MRNISKEFKSSYGTTYTVSITLKNGTVLDDMTNKDIYTLSLKDSSSSDATFDIGYCAIRELTLKLNNEDESLSEYDFAGAVVIVEAEKNINGLVENPKLGKYIVDLPEFSGTTIILNCVDYMAMLGKTIDDISGTTAATIVNSICTRFGISLATQRFAGWDTEIDIPDTTEMSYIMLLGYICQATCNYARMNDKGQLEIKWYDVSVFDSLELIDGGDFLTNLPESYDGGDFDTYQTDLAYSGGDFEDIPYHHIYSNHSEKVITEDVVITGVKVKNEEVEYQQGADGYVLLIEDNPLTKGKEEQFAKQIGLRCIGMRFRPFTVTTNSNLLIEAGDPCIITDRKGRSYYSYVTSTSFGVGAQQTVSCGAETPVINGVDSFSLVTKAVIKARQETEQRITAYDVAVQQLTELMANSFGVYKTAEPQADGSSIYYMHNKPTLDKSTTIWKMTANAFAVSTDGGKSWNAGFDSSGNAVFNILNAIGINADWINAGTLTGRKINNGNGTFSVDENGNVVSNSFKSTNAEITGGSLNINTASDNSVKKIRLSSTAYSSHMSPNAMGVSSANEDAVMGSGGLSVSSISGSTHTTVINLNKTGGLQMSTLPIICKSLSQSSDARLKKNRKNLQTNKLFDLIKPVQYKFKKKLDKTGKWHMGFYAQDILKSMKDAGIDPEEYALVNKGENGYYSINYTEMIPMLVEQVQELKKRIEVLENGNN
ncbi:MAG: tail fiber domain-containing protein [Lachnospiraceae bacterium]|nr:tail fiber domain-containing protein [Lachnospiraceae bacterium]